MLTLPSLNKRICAMYQNVCLFRGEGYFYFVYDAAIDREILGGAYE